jgi:hypothetical protein
VKRAARIVLFSSPKLNSESNRLPRALSQAATLRSTPAGRSSVIGCIFLIMHPAPLFVALKRANRLLWIFGRAISYLKLRSAGQAAGIALMSEPIDDVFVCALQAAFAPR